MSDSSRRAATTLVLLIVVGLAAPSSAALEVPALAGRVNDLAGLLSRLVATGLEQRLAELEEETGAQVVVLSIPSLEGEPLEDFSMRVAESWQLGRAGVDDGVLLLIARDERRMRLEVGYGLEGSIPDAYAKRIVDDILRPRFRNRDFDGGVTMAVEAIAGLVEGEDALPPPGAGGTGPDAAPPPSGAVAFLFFLVPMGLFSLQALTGRGCASWFLYLFLIPFWLLFPLALLGRPIGYLPVVLWIVGFPILRSLLRLGKLGGGGPFLGGGTWSGGSGWSSSRGGWGGGFGGGFSGGGGSFGGGGASGSW